LSNCAILADVTVPSPSVLEIRLGNGLVLRPTPPSGE
jgi:hypothetical protein